MRSAVTEVLDLLQARFLSAVATRLVKAQTSH